MAAARLYYVIGYQPDGTSCILSTHMTRGKAEHVATLYREHLEGYAAITVEENGESKATEPPTHTNPGEPNVPDPPLHPRPGCAARLRRRVPAPPG